MKKFTALICILLLAVSVECNELRQRGFAGFAFTGVDAETATANGLEKPEGILVTEVFQMTPAAKAGLQKGDLILQYDDHQILDQSVFLSISRKYFAEDVISVHLLRDRTKMIKKLKLQAFPKEKNTNIEIEYTSFESDGIRLRAVVTSPKGSKGKKMPGVFMVSALNSTRLIGLDMYSMTRELAHFLSGNGYRVIRFELRGFGDSQGNDYRDTDFNTEISDNVAGFDYFISRKDVDPEKTWIFGHSTGGIVAAEVAAKRKPAGVILSCTVGRTYYERMMETVRLQSEYSGENAVVIEDKIKKYLDLTVGLTQGKSLEDIVSLNPGVKTLVNNSGRIMDDRNQDYWRQQLSINLAGLYAKLKIPVMVLYCESDFLTQLQCHSLIKNILSASGNQQAVLTTVPNADHQYAAAKDKRESFDNYQTKQFRPVPEVNQLILDWLNRPVR